MSNSKFHSLIFLLGLALPLGCGGQTDTGAAPQTRPSGPSSRGQAGQDCGAGKWVSGYYAGYEHELYPPEAIDFDALTHLFVARVVPKLDGTLDTSFDIGDQGPQMAHDLVDRAHARGKKAIAMIGGAGATGGWGGAADDGHRGAFVHNLLQLKQDYGFDGLDLDWEPETGEEWVVFNAEFKPLAQALRDAAPDALLTVPVGWDTSKVTSFYGDIAPIFDQINIMTYGMANNWSKMEGADGWESWHSSALFGDASAYPSSVHRSVQAYLAAGVPPAKLGVGIGFYGSCWINGITGPRQYLHANQYIGADDDVMSFAHIMHDYYDAGAAARDDVAQVPYLSYGAPRGPQQCTFLSYEDERSIAAKGQYAQDQGLGGTIIWTINQDYIPSAPVGSRDPLLEAARQAFLAPGGGAGPKKADCGGGNPPQPVPPAGAALVYGEALDPAWHDWSYNLVSDQQVASPAMGNQAYQVSYQDWGALKLAHSTAGTPIPIRGSDYEFVSFYINPGATVPAVLDFELENGEPAVPIANYAALAPNNWTQVHIPLADVNPGHADFSYLLIKSMAGVTLSVDAIWLEPAAAGGAYTPSWVTVPGGRRYLLALPPHAHDGTERPLVIALHADGSNPDDLRASLNMEVRARGQAVFVYPQAPGSSFEYWDLVGRGKEAAFVEQIIFDLVEQSVVRPDRVFLTGLSGGATMANAIGCVLGPLVLRAVAPMSGTLYKIPDASGSYATLPGGTDVKVCNDPATLLIWGMDDTSDDTAYNPNGLDTLGKHLDNQGCSATTTAATPAPCLDYADCSEGVRWCAIPGMAHEMWSQAGLAAWTFFSSLL